MNPFAALLRSRKFLLMVLDLLVSTALYFGAKYVGPSAFEDIQFLIAVLQPVFVVGIGAIAYEDGERAKAAPDSLALRRVSKP